MSLIEHPAVVAATSVVVVLAGVFVGGGVLVDVGRRLSRWLERRCLQLLTALTFGTEAHAAEAARKLGSLPDRVVVRAAQQLALDFEGDVTERIQTLLATTGVTSHIHSRIRARAWRTRCQGATLSPLLPPGDPNRTVLVDDVNPQVRAVAISSLDAHGATERVASLLAHLDAAEEGVRLEAQQALLRADASIVPALVEHLRDAEGAAAMLALQIAAKIADPRLRQAAAPHGLSNDPTLRAMAARVQARGSADLDLLTRFLEDPEAQVRAAGAAAVAAAGAEVLASNVGRLLGDPAWAVRYEAGAALAAMGPLGRLVLRAHLNDPDPFARDMAQRTVDQLCAQGDDAVRPYRILDHVEAWHAEPAA